MKVELLNTGTELLLGTVMNTHAALLGEALFPLGLRVERQTTVPDGAAIRNALIETFGRCDILLVTGGLGPTTDDISREITAELLGLRLVLDQATLDAIKTRCARRGFAFEDRMARQALAPETATILPNAFGSAPGLYIPPQESPSFRTPHIFLMPGPPRELRPMLEQSVLPMLRDIVGAPPDRVLRTYRCVGLGESVVEARIGLGLSTRPDLEVGYCARPNEVDFRLIGSSALLDSLDPEIRAALGDGLVSVDGGPIEALVIEMLREQQLQIATAESCTGGLLANRLTNVSGASAVFTHGWVTYANEAKASQLGVPMEMIEQHGAVSAEVAGRMAEGARLAADADIALATTGIAGPTGGTAEKPVGTVYLAIARRDAPTDVWRECFPTDRETFKQVATQAILNRLRLALTRTEK